MKRLKVANKVSWFNLHHWIDDKNIRKLVYKKLTKYEKRMVSKAHGLSIKTSCSLLFHCCMHGYLSLLQYVVENIYNDRYRIFGVPFNLICQTAICHGHLDIVQWTMSQRSFVVDSFSLIAAESGHLHILQWLCAKGYPWDKNTCAGAKEKGHQHIVDWIHTNKYSCNCINK